MTDSQPGPEHGPRPSAEARHAAWLARMDDLHQHCHRVVEALVDRIPDADADRIRTGLAAGEWLFLLDDLCGALLQEQITVSPAEQDLLREALDRLGLGDETTPFVRDPDATLTALRVGAADSEGSPS